MRALIQRVAHARVTVEESIAGAIGRGISVFLGVREGDTDADAEYLAQRISQLRIFNDQDGKMNLSLREVYGQALVISQFTLHADTRRGNRPSYMAAAKPEEAERSYRLFIQSLRSLIGTENVQTGIFGAMMNVELVNEGPVTIMLESKSELEK